VPGDDQADFFVSYAEPDREWAEWISWHLEEGGGYRVLLEEWDSVPGGHWFTRRQNVLQYSPRTIAVLSAAYLRSNKRQEWHTAYRADSEGFRRGLIPIRVEDCRLPPFLEGIGSIDLFDRDSESARDWLIRRIREAEVGRARPPVAPRFPDRRPPAASDSTRPLPRTPSIPPPHIPVPARTAEPEFPGRVKAAHPRLGWPPASDRRTRRWITVAVAAAVLAAGALIAVPLLSGTTGSGPSATTPSRSGAQATASATIRTTAILPLLLPSEVDLQSCSSIPGLGIINLWGYGFAEEYTCEVADHTNSVWLTRFTDANHYESSLVATSTPIPTSCDGGDGRWPAGRGPTVGPYGCSHDDHGSATVTWCWDSYEICATVTGPDKDMRSLVSWWEKHRNILRT
jgi:hypothetical protein